MQEAKLTYKINWFYYLSELMLFSLALSVLIQSKTFVSIILSGLPTGYFAFLVTDTARKDLKVKRDLKNAKS